ncbi:fumarylacetoacetate hydrolase family protein [Sandaracinobacteroides saxicola]|uniref:Fumarylacetoacetate hydrolase family protein n=1 Tax=Sandaracinobacteroides saxicola TaxID=2759707 RepID=A0A7G5IJM7_9SPHN|nr:fumarylacetoacetate hydrolase family protein [Sandaracinobacteroides saxicola]QMW23569.1 fumarylacetoacetate hydrolase family protein [Sandaracinobacteroides saxicola]
MPYFPPPHARIFCAAVNYGDHRAEMGREESDTHPMLFLRTPQSLVPAGKPLIKPPNSDRFDYEGELALIIGRPGRHVPRAEALAHVEAWVPFMDGSVRDWQRHTAQFTPGKNFDGSGSIGDSPVPAALFGDYRRHRLLTRVNGEVVQETPVDRILFDVETLIAYVSSFTELRTGDIIATGTCGGVGDKRVPPLYLFPGDTVEVEVSGLPVLRNGVAAA